MEPKACSRRSTRHRIKSSKSNTLGELIRGLGAEHLVHLGVPAVNRLERNGDLKKLFFSSIVEARLEQYSFIKAVYFQIKDKPNLKTTLLVAFSAVTSEALLLAEDP